MLTKCFGEFMGTLMLILLGNGVLFLPAYQEV